MKKMKDLLGEVFDDTPKVNKHEVIEGVRNYGVVGKSLYNNSNIMEIAEQLAKVAESAHHHILGEQDDWFDKISVNRNMKSLKGNVMEFQKTAKEAHALNQRLTSLYEDIGHVLNRYYDIDEEIMSEDKGDMDNDGVNEPDDEEYMDNKDKAIKKAMKDESLDPDNSDQVDQPDHPAQDADEMKEAIRQTRENFNKRPTKRLKDIGNVATGIPSLGQIARKIK
jgi:hypothetical protein